MLTSQLDVANELDATGTAEWRLTDSFIPDSRCLYVLNLNRRSSQIVVITLASRGQLALRVEA